MTVLTPGQTLRNGQFFIEGELDPGRFSFSYLAKRSDGQRWVIKVLNPQVLAGLSDAEKDRQETLFWNEAIKLSKCSGTPHIARVESPFKEGKLLCLPMEYLAGDSLAKRPEQQLMEETALEYIRQIGSALAVIHAQGLIHRDICPANIYLRLLPKGQVEAVLTNFELAVNANTELSRTRTRELRHGFSPIELCTSGQTIGPYTDVYSLAATLYELLTGEVPCSSENRMLHGQSLKPPKEINPEILDRTAKAILAGMELPTKKRPQTVQKWLARFKLEDKEIQIPQLKFMEFKTPQPKPIDWGKWGAIWACLGVVVALLFGIADRLPSPKPTSQPTPQSTSTEQPSPQPIPQVEPTPQSTPTEQPASKASHHNFKLAVPIPLGEVTHVA